MEIIKQKENVVTGDKYIAYHLKPGVNLAITLRMLEILIWCIKKK